MSVAHTMQRLERLGTSDVRAMFARYGVPSPMFGVNYLDLVSISKRLRVDHDLAVALWQTGNHDARMLATRIADPAAMIPALVDAWAADLNNYLIADEFAALVFRTSVALARMQRWTGSRDEWPCRAGWSLAARFARSDPSLTDTIFLRLIEQMEARVDVAPMRAATAMKSALVCIGQRNFRLHEAATRAATRLAQARLGRYPGLSQPA